MVFIVLVNSIDLSYFACVRVYMHDEEMMCVVVVVNMWLITSHVGFFAAAVLIRSCRFFDGAGDDGAGSRRLSPMAAAMTTTKTHRRATSAFAADEAAPGQTRYRRCC